MLTKVVSALAILLVMADDLDELSELRDLYLLQRGRVRRLVEIETESGRPSAQVAREIQVATQLLVAREQLKIDLGLDGVENRAKEDPRISLSGYSEDVVRTLSHPESRHRIMSIMERVTRIGRKAIDKAELPALSAPGGEAE